MINDEKNRLTVVGKGNCCLWKRGLVFFLHLLLLLPSLAWGGCSTNYVGTVVINEYNYNSNYIELKILNPATSTVVADTNTFLGWTLDIYSKNATGTSPIRATVKDGYINQAQALCTNATYMRFNLPNGGIDGTAVAVLKDASGKEVDYFRMSETASYPNDSNPADYPSATCTSFTYPTNGPINVSNGKKGILRFPDGTGNWIVGQGQGAGSEQSPCGSNDSLLSVTTTSSSSVVGVCTSNANTCAASSYVFIWTAVIRNGGSNSLTNVQIVNELPSNMTLVNCSPACWSGSGTQANPYYINVGTLAAGASYTTTMKTYVTAAGTYTIDIGATATELSPGYAHGLATVTALVSGNTLDHYRIDHTGSGVTCVGSTVTINRCSSADINGVCAPFSPNSNVTGNLLVKDSTNTITLSTLAFTIPANSSSVNVSVPITTAQTVNLSTSVTPQTCWNSSAANTSCSFIFSDAGFLFDVVNHISETLQTVNISAVKKSDNSLACIPAFSNVAKNVTFKCSYSNPGSGTLPVRVNGNALNAGNNLAAVCDAGGRTVNLSFNGSGIASTTFQYADVGNMALTATYTGSGSDAGLIMTGTDSFIAAPKDFVFSNITAAPIKAGNNFNASVTARNNAGNVTPNFGKETSPESVTLSFNKYQPTGTGSVNGIFSGNTGAFNNGIATAANLNWSEVGVIDLTATLTSGSYLDSGLTATGTTGITGGVGRFIPDHFNTTVTQGCSVGGFTYSGQPFSVTVTAMNGLATPTKTVNYDGSLSTAPNFSKTVTLSDANGIAGSLAPVTVAANSFSAGVANATPTFTFTTMPTAPATIKLRAVDTDSVSTGTEGTALIRSGRLQFSNGYGSELVDLALPLTAQYWNGSNWITNIADSCTTIAAANFAFTFPAVANNKLAACETAVTLTGSAPNFLATLKAPNGGNNGWTDVVVNLDGAASGGQCTAVGGAGAAAITAAQPWLRYNWTGSVANPVARANFGVYKGNTRQIYFRELY